jgi:hypothetical protein
MSLIEFLKDLSQKGITLKANGEKLEYRGTKEAINVQVLSQLKQHKQAILQLLVQGIDLRQTYPLSYSQKSLWFVHQIAPHSTAYNVAFTAYILSPLDIEAFQQALRLLIARHPILRTSFTLANDIPIQQIHSEREPVLQIIPAAEWTEFQLNQKVIEAYKTPFNLEIDPLVRVYLFQRSPTETILLLTMHHIIIDGWSSFIVLEELEHRSRSEKCPQISGS